MHASALPTLPTQQTLLGRQPRVISQSKKTVLSCLENSGLGAYFIDFLMTRTIFITFEDLVLGFLRLTDIYN